MPSDIYTRRTTHCDRLDMDQLTRMLVMVVLSMMAQSAEAACPTQKCECGQDPTTGRIAIVCQPMPGKILNEIPKFTPDSFPYSKLIMAGHNISVIPRNAFAGISFEELNLADNPITHIDEFAFNGTVGDITSLILHSKQIQEFPTMAVNILPELNSLSLKNFNLQSLPIGPFERLNKLQKLTIDTCSLETLQDTVFQNQVDSLTDLNLHGNRFRSVPTAIRSLNKLDSFIFSQQNGLNEIPDNAFQGIKSLKYLDISQNSLSKIHSNAFTGLNNMLETLISDHCTLTDQSLMSLRQLQTLKELKLGHNQITNIASDVFDSMSNLEILKLNRNKLTSINQGMFQGIGDKLRELHLEDNQLSNIDRGTFSVFKNLTGLHLDNNKIGSQLTGNVFENQQNTLQFLRLENTSFSTENLATISNLVELQTLRLAKNNVEFIPDFTFKSNNKLSFLDLSYNKLKQLTQAQLFGLENSLQNLWLTSNNISTLEECTFFQFSINIYKLHLQYNPLTCDCHLKWLKEKHLQEQDSVQDLFMNWRCSAPDPLRQVFFHEAPLDKFVCDTTSKPTNCEEIYWQFTTTEAPTISTLSSTGAPVYTGGVTPSSHGDNSTGKSTTPASGSSSAKVDATESTAGSSTMFILIGAIVGALVVLAIVAVVLWVVCRRRRAEKAISRGPITNGMPRSSYDSKRFTRPPPSATELENDRNSAFEGPGANRGSALAGRGAAGCTVSTISPGVTPRYVYDPTAPTLPAIPPGADRYPYPAHAKQGTAQYHDNSAYKQEDYDEIPADKLDGYARADPNRQGHDNQAFDYHKYQLHHTYNMPDSPGHSNNIPESPGHIYNMPDSPGHTYNMPDYPGYDKTSQEVPVDNLNINIPSDSTGFEADLPNNPPAVVTTSSGHSGNVNMGYDTDSENTQGDVHPYSVRDVVKHIPKEPQGQVNKGYGDINQEPQGQVNKGYGDISQEPQGQVNKGYDASKEQYLHTQNYGTTV